MKGILPLLFATAALAISAHAQNATTTPVGVMTIDFPATGTSPATTSKYISVPLHSDPAYSGKPTSVTSNTLVFSGVNWTISPSQFGSTPSDHIVRILTGQQAGRILHVISNTSDTITVSVADRTNQSTALDFAGFSVTTQDVVEVVPCDTLAGLFGDGSLENPLLLTGSTSVFTADTIGIVDRATGKTLAYFFDTSAGVNQWRRSGSSVNRNNFAIYPEDGILIVRRTNRPFSQLVLLGRVPKVAPLLKAAPGSAYLTTLGVPVDMPLSNIFFAGAWTRGASMFVSDTIGVYDPAFSRFVAYYQRQSDATWRSSASTAAPNVSATIIPAGTALSILERTSNKTGAESFNSFALPYSL